MLPPEIREWTLVRLSYFLPDRVTIATIAIGYFYNCHDVADGEFNISGRILTAAPDGRQIQTTDTLYQLKGPATRLGTWDDERFTWLWETANYGFGCLVQVEEVTPSTDWLAAVLVDPAIIQLHQAQNDLLTAIYIATDIDRGLVNGRDHSYDPKADALMCVFDRTPFVEEAIEAARDGVEAFSDELGGLIPIGRNKNYAPELTLPHDGLLFFPRRVEAVAKAAVQATNFLPSTLGPWGCCAWLIAPNPHTPGFRPPLAIIEAGQVAEAVRAAKAFPNVPDYGGPTSWQKNGWVEPNEEMKGGRNPGPTRRPKRPRRQAGGLLH